MRFKFAKAKKKPYIQFADIVAKSEKGRYALDKLNSFLDTDAPQMATFLQRMYNNQQNAITYTELRDAVINGYISKSTIKSWQEDYAAFVNEHLRPGWIEAMKIHSEELEKQYPTFFFDPMQKGVQEWLKKNGARWVTNQSDTTKEAIRSMLEYSSTGALTVDELARAIRPTIGLTKPQAQANLRYYESVKAQLKESNPTMKPEIAEKKAESAAMKYASKQQRYRADTIAQTELAYAYNQGMEESVKQAQEQGYMGKVVRRWLAAPADGKRCDLCAELDGKEIAMDDEYDIPGISLFAGAHAIPPAHPRCRCMIEYVETEPPNMKNLFEQQGFLDTNTPETVQKPKIPKDIDIPNGLKNCGSTNLGGTGTMYTYTDEKGKEWLFKPAQSKGGKPEPFRAYAQKSAYKVQHIVDPDTSIRVGVGEIDGELGAFQERINTLKDGINLKSWQHTGGSIDTDILEQIQREHTTDWLCGNFDAHGGNFIFDEKGKLRGIDKEQSFRYMSYDAKHMSYKYHPNAAYGETEPIYNTVYRRFAKGEIDLNLQDTLTAIKRVESVADAEYKEIFRDYAEALYGKGKKAEQLLDDILERKKNLREEYRRFYGELLTERTGKKQKFIWADETTIKQKIQPISSVRHTPENLTKMPLGELKKIAKAQKIAYYNNMNKTQLITAISDPTQASVMSMQVKNRLASNAAARISSKPTAVKPKNVIGADDIFNDFANIPKNDPRGIVVYSDESNVEGLNLTIRHITIDKQQYYEISGKITKEKYNAIINNLKNTASKSEMGFEKTDSLTKEFHTDSGMGFNKLVIKSGDIQFEAYDNTDSTVHHAWEGYFRVRTVDNGTGKSAAKTAKNFLKDNGLDEITHTPTKEAEDILKKKRLIWQHAPNRVAEYEGLTGRTLNDKINSIMKDEGISQNRLKNMVFEKVADGYGTYVEKGILKEYQKEGLTYVWSGVRTKEGIVGIVKNGGMASTNNRCIGGFFDPYAGASSYADMGTGGSDSVFTRIGVKNAHTRYNSCYSGGPYRIKFKAEIMERTDWYAYDSDNYGTTKPSEMNSRYSAKDFIRRMNTNYRKGNEIMFRRGIPVSEFEEIIAETTVDKQQLIRLFNQEGITDVNGIPLARFIKVGSNI